MVAQDVTSRGQRSAGSQRIPRGSRADAAARRRRTTTKRHRLPIACAASQMSRPGACRKCRIFFSPIMCWFLFDGWRRAVLDSARELFTNPCKRNPPAPNSVCRAKTLNNHHAPSLAIVASSGGCQIHLANVKSCPPACSTGMRSTWICCKYFEPEQPFALEKSVVIFHIDTCAQALFQCK